MIGAPIPQDILKYEAKFALNLSARQCIFYLAGAVVGGTFMMTLPHTISTNIRAMIMAAVAVPFFVWGTVKPFGQPLEKIIVPFLFDNFLNPKLRLKETHHIEYERDHDAALKQADIRDRAKKSKTYKAIS